MPKPPLDGRADAAPPDAEAPGGVTIDVDAIDEEPRAADRREGRLLPDDGSLRRQQVVEGLLPVGQREIELVERGFEGVQLVEHRTVS